jgi:hypothetical protein
MTGSPGDNSGEKKPVPPCSPSRRPRHRSRSINSHSRTQNAGGRVIERVVERPSVNVAWPMLTRTNYREWALVMEVNYQTLGVWEIVQHGLDDNYDQVEYHDDRQAMASLLRSVPSDLLSTLDAKTTMKQAWDAVKNL